LLSLDRGSRGGSASYHTMDIVLLETRHSDSTAIEKMMTGAGYRVVTTVGDDTVFRQVKDTAGQMEENKLS